MKSALQIVEEDIIKPIPSSSKTTSIAPEKLAWVIWSCAALFYLYEYVLRVSPSVMVNELMLAFSVNSAALGLLSSFYYWAYVPLQIPCGVIVDWLGPRKVITFSALLCVIGSFAFAQSENLFVAQLARFLIGAGSACAYLSCTKVGADWFSPDRFALITGITMMMGTFGGIFGNKPFAMLVNTFGWRESMMLAAIVGIVVTLTCWIIIRDRPAGETSRLKSENIPLLQGLKIVASNPQSWLIGIYGGLMYVPISAFAELWGVPYLMEVHNITNEQASVGSTMLFIGMAIGSPLGALLSNKLKSRRKVMSYAALLTMFMFCMVIYIPALPLSLTFALQFFAGLFCGGQILYFVAAKEINPPHSSGTTIGFINALVMVSGIIFQPLLGQLLHIASAGQVKLDGTPYYSPDAYQVALTAVPLCLLGAWLVLKLVRETYPVSAHSTPLSTI